MGKQGGLALDNDRPDQGLAMEAEKLNKVHSNMLGIKIRTCSFF